MAWVSPVGLADCASLLPDDLTEHPTSVGLLRRSVGSVSLGLSGSPTQLQLNTPARFRKRGNMRSSRLMLLICGVVDESRMRSTLSLFSTLLCSTRGTSAGDGLGLLATESEHQFRWGGLVCCVWNPYSVDSNLFSFPFGEGTCI